MSSLAIQKEVLGLVYESRHWHEDNRHGDIKNETSDSLALRWRRFY